MLIWDGSISGNISLTEVSKPAKFHPFIIKQTFLVVSSWTTSLEFHDETRFGTFDYKFVPFLTYECTHLQERSGNFLLVGGRVRHIMLA